MYLVYIENKNLLTKIITYFDYGNILYTTDINDKYDFLIIAQNNNKTLNLMQRAKRTIYISYLDEIKIFKRFSKKNKKYDDYKNKMNTFFNKCNIIVTSLPYMKRLINHKRVYVIPFENICIGLCKNKLFNLRKKNITIIDSDYKYLDIYFKLFNEFPNFQYQLIGFSSSLNKKNKLLITDLPKNLTLYKYCNDRVLQNYIDNSFLVIFFDNILESYDYLNICLFLKKNILLLNSDLCRDFLIDNKNIYLFDEKSLVKKFNKIITNRVSNLGIEGFNLIKDNNFINISDKFCKILK